MPRTSRPGRVMTTSSGSSPQEWHSLNRSVRILSLFWATLKKSTRYKSVNLIYVPTEFIYWSCGTRRCEECQTPSRNSKYTGKCIQVGIRNAAFTALNHTEEAYGNAQP